MIYKTLCYITNANVLIKNTAWLLQSPAFKILFQQMYLKSRKVKVLIFISNENPYNVNTDALTSK